MVKVSSVNRVFDVGGIFDPHILLLHNLLKWISKIVFILSRLVNNLVKSWIQLHNGVLFIIKLVFEKPNSPEVVPVLRIVLQKPGIVILQIKFWLRY